MWIIYALLGALFAGITSILAKIGVKNVNSHLLTALRTVVVLVFAWLMVFVKGSGGTIWQIDTKSLIFLVLSGITTGASWLCYFRAIQLGDASKVAPIDKSSAVITILLGFLVLGEPMGVYTVIGMVLIACGIYLMTVAKKSTSPRAPMGKWALYAAGSAVFAALTSILAKIGIENVESNLGVAIRTVVVLIFAFGIVFATKKHTEIKNIDKNSWLFIFLSGLATGLSWLFFYRALQIGNAGVVVSIDKLSIVITVLFAALVLKEKQTKRSVVGLCIMCAGTLMLLVK